MAARKTRSIPRRSDGTFAPKRAARRNGARRSVNVWDGRGWKAVRLAGNHPAAVVSSYARRSPTMDRDAAAVDEELTLDEAIAAQDADETGVLYVLRGGMWRETNRRPR